jgi:hypothetical protein
MDGASFDRMARELAAGRTRRNVIKGLGAAALGALGLAGAGRRAGADECKGTGKACSKGSQCCSGNCAPAPDKGSVAGSGSICCAAGQGNCGGACADLTTITNCGACGTVCPTQRHPHLQCRDLWDRLQPRVRRLRRRRGQRVRNGHPQRPGPLRGLRHRLPGGHRLRRRGLPTAGTGDALRRSGAGPVRPLRRRGLLRRPLLRAMQGVRRGRLGRDPRAGGGHVLR